MPPLQLLLALTIGTLSRTRLMSLILGERWDDTDLNLCFYPPPEESEVIIGKMLTSKTNGGLNAKF